mgnify:CR=1 FL=1
MMNMARTTTPRYAADQAVPDGVSRLTPGDLVKIDHGIFLTNIAKIHFETSESTQVCSNHHSIECYYNLTNILVFSARKGKSEFKYPGLDSSGVFAF